MSITSYVVIGHNEPGKSGGTHINVPSGPHSLALAKAVLEVGKSSGQYDKRSRLGASR